MTTDELLDSMSAQEIATWRATGQLPTRIIQQISNIAKDALSGVADPVSNQTPIQPGPAQPGFPIQDIPGVPKNFSSNQNIVNAYNPMLDNNQSMGAPYPQNAMAPMYSEPDPFTETFYNQSVAPQAPQFEDLDIASLSGYNPNAPETQPMTFNESLIPQAQQALRNSRAKLFGNQDYGTPPQPGPGHPGFQGPATSGDTSALKAAGGGWAGNIPSLIDLGYDVTMDVLGSTANMVTGQDIPIPETGSDFINQMSAALGGSDNLLENTTFRTKMDEFTGTAEDQAAHPYWTLAGELGPSGIYGIGQLGLAGARRLGTGIAGDINNIDIPVSELYSGTTVRQSGLDSFNPMSELDSSFISQTKPVFDPKKVKDAFGVNTSKLSDSIDDTYLFGDNEFNFPAMGDSVEEAGRLRLGLGREQGGFDPFSENIMPTPTNLIATKHTPKVEPENPVLFTDNDWPITAVEDVSIRPKPYPDVGDSYQDHLVIQQGREMTERNKIIKQGREMTERAKKKREIDMLFNKLQEPGPTKTNAEAVEEAGPTKNKADAMSRLFTKGFEIGQKAKKKKK